MIERLPLLDRVTVAVWRITNAIGWCIVALLGAALVRLALQIVLGSSAFMSGSALHPSVLTLSFKSGLAGVATETLYSGCVGLTVGWIVGGRVRYRSSLVAAAAAFVYSLLLVVPLSRAFAFGLVEPGSPSALLWFLPLLLPAPLAAFVVVHRTWPLAWYERLRTSTSAASGRADEDSAQRAGGGDPRQAHDPEPDLAEQRGLMHEIRAELRTLRRPYVVKLAATVMLLGVACTFIGSRNRVHEAAAAAAATSSPPSDGCPLGPVLCAARQRGYEQSQAQQSARRQADLDEASPAAAGKHAAGHMASLLGWVFIIALGTVPATRTTAIRRRADLPASVRRVRVLATFASLLIVAVAVMLALTAALALLAALSGAREEILATTPGLTTPRGVRGLGGSFRAIGGATLVMALASSVACVTSVITARRATARAISTAAIAGSAVLGGFPGLARFSISAWTASVMGFAAETRGNVYWYLWRDEYGAGGPVLSARTSSIACATVTLVLLAAALRAHPKPPSLVGTS